MAFNKQNSGKMSQTVVNGVGSFINSTTAASNTINFNQKVMPI